MGGTVVTNQALNALWERAEIFNKMEETTAQLNEEEAKIVTVYAENLLKTRPQRRPESCSESGQVQDTNCWACREGIPRKTDSGGYYHEINISGEYGPFRNICRGQNAQN